MCNMELIAGVQSTCIFVAQTFENCNKAKAGSPVVTSRGRQLSRSGTRVSHFVRAHKYTRKTPNSSCQY